MLDSWCLTDEHDTCNLFDMEFLNVWNCILQEPFPLHAIYGSVWKNTEGQLSFLKYAVYAPPEIFTFAHSARQLVWFSFCISIVSCSQLQIFTIISYAGLCWCDQWPQASEWTCKSCMAVYWPFGCPLPASWEGSCQCCLVNPWLSPQTLSRNFASWNGTC